jgi:hypothetical protein
LVGHPTPGNGTESDPAKNKFGIGCLTCHGGQYPGSLHGYGSTALQEGTEVTAANIVGAAPYVMRLRNGASVPAHRIKDYYGADDPAVNTCYSTTSTTSAFYPANACTQNHDSGTDWGGMAGEQGYTYTGNP